MATANIQNVKQKNEAYASNFKHGDLALPPAKKYLVVTCMDARIVPSVAFGIDIGDAHVIRNAGGSAKDALRSILISEQLLGTQEIILVKHTGCGMLTFTNEDAHGLVAQRLGPTAGAEIATLNFLPFSNVEQAVRDDIDFLQRQSAVPKDVTISGWVYEVESGRVRQVVEPTTCTDAQAIRRRVHETPESNVEESQSDKEITEAAAHLGTNL